MGDEAVECPAEEGHQSAVGHGIEAGGIACIQTVDGGNECDEFRLGKLATFVTGCFHDDYDSRHAEQVRHDVGDNGQIDQGVHSETG